jgi:hypothetical protein
VIGGVQHAVGVIVGISTTVLVLERIAIFWLLRALVVRIAQPIAVAVRNFIGAAIFVLEAVLGLGVLRTSIDAVQQTVFVRVERCRRTWRRYLSFYWCEREPHPEQRAKIRGTEAAR